MEDRDVSELIYLYGFVPADAPQPPPSLAGIADRPTELLSLDAVAAVISRVPATEYDPDLVEARLEDLGWVGAQGLAHERVVLWFVDNADILPVRLLSMHSNVDALRRALHLDVAGIAAQLARLRGRREWNLKVAYDDAELVRHGAAVSEELRTLDADISGAPPGRRYLLERKRAEVAKGEVARAAQRLAAELLDALRPIAEDARVLPLAAGDQTGSVVLNAALLVRRDAEPALRAEAERRIAAHRALGMLPNLSGPWAPYRFLQAHDT